MRGGFHFVLILGMLFVAFFVIIFRFLIVDDVTFAFVFMFVAFLGIVRTEAFGADEGRQMFNVGNQILSSLIESQGIGVELLQVVEKVERVAGLIPCVHFLDDR